MLFGFNANIDAFLMQTFDNYALLLNIFMLLDNITKRFVDIFQNGIKSEDLYKIAVVKMKLKHCIKSEQ